MVNPSAQNVEYDPCAECKGAGRIGAGYLREDCPACNGTGKARQAVQSVNATRRREPGTPISEALDIDVAKQQMATSVTRRSGLSQDHWIALLDWLDYLQAEFPKRSAEEWKALLKGMPR